MKKYINIIGWLVTVFAALMAPVVDSIYMYSIAFVMVLVMYVISEIDIYDNEDDSQNC